MGTLSQNYSGIVINQNAIPASSSDYQGLTTSTSFLPGSAATADWHYQGFSLPTSYPRGTNSAEINYPDLSGLQVLVSVDTGYSSSATLDWRIDKYVIGSGWMTLGSGTNIGCATDGKVWYDIFFPTTIPVTPDMMGSNPLRLRFGIAARTSHNTTLSEPVLYESGYATVNGNTIACTLVEGVPFPILIGNIPGFLLMTQGVVTYSVQQGISSIWFSQPNPLPSGIQAFSSSMSPLVSSQGNPFSFCFRLLGLTADNGVDFLGNGYRSIVINHNAQNVDTTGAFTLGGSQGIGYWMSDPCPSQFGVKSIYFDMRPTSALPSYGQINFIGNPNFGYDQIGAPPAWWSSSVSTGSSVTLAVTRGTWYVSGNNQNSLHITGTIAPGGVIGVASPLNIIPVTGGQSVFVSGTINALTIPTNTGVEFNINWFNGSSYISSSSITHTTTGAATLALTGVPPVNATFASITIWGFNNSGASQAIDFYIDAIQATTGLNNLPYGDGDQIGWTWTGQKGRSTSTQIIEPTPQDNTVVIDSVFIDPVISNLGFNVYYSTDGNPGTIESEWEQKLWAHVPQSYVTTTRQKYYFPLPVVAKYMKVEFTNLQPRPYNPGNFAKPVSYKKFPKWVADFFIAQMQLPSFIAKQVNVSYDALTFAYNYYLDDIGQSPAAPKTTDVATVNSFLSTLNDFSDQVDPTTLQKINLVFNTYTQPPGIQASSDTLLGSSVKATATSQSNYPVESGPVAPAVNYSDVSSLNRESIVYEQSMPVMFFYLTCRHAYRELMAPFEYNRAYFAGVNSITFIRDNYSISTNTPQYIETGGDSTNLEINDWVIDDTNNLYAY